MADQHQYSRHPLPPPPSHEHYPHQDASYDYNQQQPQEYQQQSPTSPQQPAFAQQPPRQQQQQQQLRQPPPAQVAHQQKPSKPRTFSFQSGKSHRSSGSHPKYDDTHETSAEKESHRLHSKADPTMAISEAEPATIQAMTKSSLAPLRAIQHRDSFGNAIDNGARFPQDSYYGGRPNSMRPESAQMEYNNHNRSGYFDPSHGQGGYGPGPSRQRASRMNSEPMNGYGRGAQQVYPMPHKDRSYETVTTAAGSGHSEQAGYQTDPTSSDNSSIERVSPAKRAEPANDYGIGFNQQGSYQPSAFNNYASGANGAGPSGANYQPAPMTNSNTAPPAAPQKMGGMLRKQSTQQSTQQRPDVGEKRKSWFSRRFSKAN
ncbi:hypothetical protein ACHAQH_005188 [Verticillium albo-atrum]